MIIFAPNNVAHNQRMENERCITVCVPDVWCVVAQMSGTFCYYDVHINY